MGALNPPALRVCASSRGILLSKCSALVTPHKMKQLCQMPRLRSWWTAASQGAGSSPFCLQRLAWLCPCTCEVMTRLPVFPVSWRRGEKREKKAWSPLEKGRNSANFRGEFYVEMRLLWGKGGRTCQLILTPTGFMCVWEKPLCLGTNRQPPSPCQKQSTTWEGRKQESQGEISPLMGHSWRCGLITAPLNEPPGSGAVTAPTLSSWDRMLQAHALSSPSPPWSLQLSPSFCG